MIVMRDIRLESHCEHHIVPILGKVHIGYLPSDRVVGISKLARVVEVFAKRLQIQETLTAQTADTIQKVLQPQGVGVVIEAAHQCMTTRGVRKPGVSMITSRMLGSFRDDPTTRREFLSISEPEKRDRFGLEQAAAWSGTRISGFRMATLTYLTTTHFDFGAIQKLPAELGRAGISKPLIATDKGVRSAGLVEAVTGAIGGDMAISIFDETPGNPTEAAVFKAFDQYTSDGCNGVVAIGGGSSMDLGKAVALLAGSGGPLDQYDPLAGGAKRVQSVAPLIAGPTTSGTGSEVSVGFVIFLEDGRKLTFTSPHFVPKAAICDPELTLDLPAMMTAATGMDAITHCIEAFLTPTINPPADGVALDAYGAAGATCPLP